MHKKRDMICYLLSTLRTCPTTKIFTKIVYCCVRRLNPELFVQHSCCSGPCNECSTNCCPIKMHSVLKVYIASILFMGDAIIYDKGLQYCAWFSALTHKSTFHSRESALLWSKDVDLLVHLKPRLHHAIEGAWIRWCLIRNQDKHIPHHDLQMR